MAKHIPQRSKKNIQMREREKRIEEEQKHEAELIEDILNEFKNFDENAQSFALNIENEPEPEYGFEMPQYVKDLFSGNTVNLADDPVPTVADFKLDPKIFEPVEEDTYVEPESEFEFDIEPDEEIDFFSELFVKSSPSIDDNNEKFERSGFYDGEEMDIEATKVIPPIIKESAGMEITEEDYSDNSFDVDDDDDDEDDEDHYSTRELRTEFFTQEFDKKFREMFAGSLDDEQKKMGGRRVRGAMVTNEDLAANQRKYDTETAMTEARVAADYDETEHEAEEETYDPKKAKKKKKGGVVWVILIILFTCIFLFAGYQFAHTYLSQLNESKALSNLADIVAMAEDGYTGTVEYNGVTYEPPVDDGSGRLLKYQQLAEMNDDMIGWLSIPGIGVNYPVMYTPDDPEYYLHRDFEGKKSSSGMLFVDANCDIENGDNQIIYGHNMKNDTMFGKLDLYKDPVFWQENQYIVYDSIYETHTYQVVCVFESRVLDKDEEGFRYYRFYGSENEEEFNEYIEEIKDLELYDTGVDISYGDRLITLSTCAYFTDEGRFVVVAKQVD